MPRTNLSEMKTNTVTSSMEYEKVTEIEKVLNGCCVNPFITSTCRKFLSVRATWRPSLKTKYSPCHQKLWKLTTDKNLLIGTKIRAKNYDVRLKNIKAIQLIQISFFYTDLEVNINARLAFSPSDRLFLLFSFWRAQILIAKLLKLHISVGVLLKKI